MSEQDTLVAPLPCAPLPQHSYAPPPPKSALDRAKGAVRALIGWWYLRSGRVRRAIGDAAVVVLFHRVNDRYPGAHCNVTTQQFQRWCAFLAGRFHVVPLSQLVSALEAGEPVSGQLSITFDDGYRSVLHAGRILARFKLPACVFVTSGWLGTDTIPEWDAGWGTPGEWLTVGDLRELLGLGMEVGAHTVHHVDLGRVAPDVAYEEITESRRQIESALDITVDLFAYPFGGRDQITEAALEHVRGTGFRCCASAYGGLVQPADDPMMLRRVSTEWVAGPYEWLYYLVQEEGRRL